MDANSIAIIAAAVLAIVGVVVGFTKSKKDDRVLELITEVLEKLNTGGKK